MRSFPQKGVTGGNLSTTRVATERGEKPRRVCEEARSSAQVPAIACLLTELRHRAGAGKRRGSPLTARLFLGQARGCGEGTSGPPGIAGGGGHRSGRGRPAPPRGWGRAGPGRTRKRAAAGVGARPAGPGAGCEEEEEEEQREERQQSEEPPLRQHERGRGEAAPRSGVRGQGGGGRRGLGAGAAAAVAAERGRDGFGVAVRQELRAHLPRLRAGLPGAELQLGAHRPVRALLDPQAPRRQNLPPGPGSRLPGGRGGGGAAQRLLGGSARLGECPTTPFGASEGAAEPRGRPGARRWPPPPPPRAAAGP